MHVSFNEGLEHGPTDPTDECVDLSIEAATSADQAFADDGGRAESSTRKLAFLAVLVISASTVGATQLTKVAQEGLDAPFFVMYLHLSLMAVCWPVARLLANGTPVTPLFGSVVVMLPLLAAGTYFYVRALSLAAPGLVQALFGIGPAVVTVLCWLLLFEPLSTMRVVAVSLAFCGTLLVSLQDQSGSGESPGQTVLGCVLALCAVLASALYKVLFKVKFKKPDLPFVLGFIGTLGAAAAVVGLPIAVALALAGVEDKWWSGTPEVNWSIVFASAAVDVVYNAALVYGVSVASPVFIALGIILGTPINMVIDFVLRGTRVGPFEGTGAAVIALSFAILASQRPQRVQRASCVAA